MLDISGLQVLYEDNHLIAVHKPAGWLSQGDKTGDTAMPDYVKAYIKKKYKKEGDVFLGSIHRLDRPVSGVLVFARTSKALTRMNKLFQDQEVDKIYWAITSQRPDPISGTLEHFLLKDRTRNITKAYDKLSNRAAGAKKSTLKYKLIGQSADNHLIEVKPMTGRSHQIRVQLATIGCSIRGDLKYGYPRANKDSSIHLHCTSMSFIHPVKKERIKISSRPPKDQIWGHFKHFFEY